MAIEVGTDFASAAPTLGGCGCGTGASRYRALGNVAPIEGQPGLLITTFDENLSPLSRPGWRALGHLDGFSDTPAMDASPFYRLTVIGVLGLAAYALWKAGQHQ